MPYGDLGLENFVLTNQDTGLKVDKKTSLHKYLKGSKVTDRSNLVNYYLNESQKEATKMMRKEQKKRREAAFANPDRTRQALMEQEGLGTYDPKAGKWNFKSNPDSIVDFAVKQPRLFSENLGMSCG